MAVIIECINEHGGGYRIHDDFIVNEEEQKEIFQRIDQVVTKSLMRQEREKIRGDSVPESGI